MQTNRAVGLIILTDLPHFGGRVALLSVRGEFNDETLNRETYPGACQLTIHGGCREEESFEQALHREIFEEFNLPETHPVQQALKRCKIPLCEVQENRIIKNFGAYLPMSDLNDVRLNFASGGLRIFRQETIASVQNILKFDKKEGVLDRRITAMLPSDLSALELAFRLIKS